MSFASTRAAIASALSTALAPRKVFDYVPIPVAIGTGWLVLTLADQEETAYGEIARVTYDVMIALATDIAEADREFDAVAGQLIEALELVGRGTSVRPVTLTLGGSDIYCAAGTFITEVRTL